MKRKGKNAHAQALRHLRDLKLSKKRRTELARRAAEARWSKRKEGVSDPSVDPS